MLETSVHVLLSVMVLLILSAKTFSNMLLFFSKKGRGFLVRDARLRTHDLEWRNRTSSVGVP